MTAITEDSRDLRIPLRKQRTFWGDAWRRLRAHNPARLGMLIIVSLILVAVLAPVVVPYDPKLDSNLALRLKSPSGEHPFGTDSLGRDVLIRVAHGARISLRVGLLAVGIALLVGTPLGLIAGFLGGWVDNVSMRLMDIVLAFPGMLLAIAIVAMRGPGLNNTMIAIGIVYIPPFARLTRSMVLSLKEQEYVTAARCVGVRDMRLIFRHVLPNSLAPVIVQGTLSLANAILDAAGLGFLGLGAQPPHPEWGAMLSDSYKYLTTGAWWVLLFPGLAIMLSVLGFNLFGDGLRDALDPRLRTD